MFIAATPNSYDVVFTNGLVDYLSNPTGDPFYNGTTNYYSDRTIWEYLQARLPVSPSGLPAVKTLPAERPRASLVNVVLKHDTNFTAINLQQLGLSFVGNTMPNSEQDAYVASHFDHDATDFFLPWSLADDPNIKAAAAVVPETVRLTLVLTNYLFATNGGQVLSIDLPRKLIDNAPIALAARRLAVTQATATVTEADNYFQRFLSADVSIQITRNSEYSAAGETETMRIANLDLTSGSGPNRVRSARYQCVVTPVISGAPRSNTLGFILSVKLDPPVEFSIRTPVRRGDKITLPMNVIRLVVK